MRRKIYIILLGIFLLTGCSKKEAEGFKGTVVLKETTVSQNDVSQNGITLEEKDTEKDDTVSSIKNSDSAYEYSRFEKIIDNISQDTNEINEK